MNHQSLFNQLREQFNLTLYDPTTRDGATYYTLLYKNWCHVGKCIEYQSNIILIIGYFVCWLDDLFGAVCFKQSNNEIIDTKTIWMWIVGAIQKPIKYTIP